MTSPAEAEWSTPSDITVLGRRRLEQMGQKISLETARLIIRDVRAEDLAGFHAMRSDPEVARFMDDLEPETPAHTRRWLDGDIDYNRRVPREGGAFAIVSKEDGRVIGWIETGPSSRYPSEGELGFGYALNRAYWDRGYATEAVRAVVDFGFRTLNASRQSAWCYADNRASARVLEKAGLRLARVFRKINLKSGQEAECREYAITAVGWNAIRQTNA